MKALVKVAAISSLLCLSACDDESLADVEQKVAEEESGVSLKVRVAFDPNNSVLSLPNDILFSGTTDGTLKIPVVDENDISDPRVALSAIDGWSTINPFQLVLDAPDGTSLDPMSVTAESVKIYEVITGGPTSPAPCNALPSGIACQLVGELTFQQDFIASGDSGNVTIVPLKPLKPKTTYVVVLTDSLQDTNGNAVENSSTYSVVKQDINENPLGGDSQLQLQAAINSFENIAQVAGVEKPHIIYSMAMTTQSTNDVLITAKKLLAAPLAQGATPAPITVTDTTFTIAQVLMGQGVNLSPELQALYSTGNMYQGSLTLPYYLGVPSIENTMAPVNTWWKALCDSGVMLAALPSESIPSGPLSESDAACMALGLRDLSSVLALDTERNLTKFNPVPAPQVASDIPHIAFPGTLSVQMTVPNISPTTDAVRASYGLPPLAEVPAGGWPVVILQHGIRSQKEDMIALTGILSTFGYATAAIDHPLHGSRGFDLDNDGTDDINATTVSPTHYMNLASLLTTRDNVRQSTLDTLGLRLSLNAVVGAPINGLDVSLIGHSLGSITGLTTSTLANEELNAGVDPSDALDALFAIDTNVWAMPGVGIAHFLMESPAFSNLIKANITLGGSDEFSALVASLYPNGDYTEAELVGLYQQFVAQLTQEQTALLAADFASFTIAAQNVLDSGDPVNYASSLAATDANSLLIEVVGNGADNLSDQVIPNLVTTSPLSGTEAAIRLLALPSVSETSLGSGAVRFLNGHHGSLLTPQANDASPDVALSAAATVEMQSQIAGFIASKGQQIMVTNSAVVK